MRTIALIHADFMKQRHTPYFCIHSVIPVTGGYPVCVLLPALSECR